jgi:hypothetical protein
VLYAHLAQLRRQHPSDQSEDGFVTLAELDHSRQQLLQHYATLYNPYSGRVEMVRKQWDKALPGDNVRSHIASINCKIRQAIPDTTQALYYLISSEGDYGNTRYGLHLPPEKILFVPEKR